MEKSKLIDIYNIMEKTKIRMQREEIEMNRISDSEYRKKLKQIYGEKKAWDISDKIETNAYKNLDKISDNANKMMDALIAYMKISIIENEEKRTQSYNKLLNKK